MSTKRGPMSKRIDELQEQYHWKAENIIRFFKELGMGMTEQQKVDFLARELAAVHWAAEIVKEH